MGVSRLTTTASAGTVVVDTIRARFAPKMRKKSIGSHPLLCAVPDEPDCAAKGETR
jgi:hypothetical protein